MISGEKPTLKNITMVMTKLIGKKTKKTLYSVIGRSDGKHNFCPLCDAALSSCHIGVYCNHCPYVDGIAWLTPIQVKKYKNKLYIPKKH